MNKNITEFDLEKVAGGYWCPPTDEGEGGIDYPFSTTDGINENGVYIGVNVPGGCGCACPNNG